MVDDDDDPEQFLEEKIHILTPEQAERLEKFFNGISERGLKAIRESQQSKDNKSED